MRVRGAYVSRMLLLHVPSLGLGGSLGLVPSPPIPTRAQVMDAHFAVRLRLRSLKKSLEDRAVAMRTIEKRLLMRFKVGGGGCGRVCVCV